MRGRQGSGCPGQTAGVCPGALPCGARASLGRPDGFGDSGSGEPLLKGLPVLGSRTEPSRAGAEPARMGLMPARAAGRFSPARSRSAPQRSESPSPSFPFLSLCSCSAGQEGLRCAVVPPRSPLAAPPCSLPGSRCLRMPRSLVVVPLGCSAAPVPDTSPASSWARGRGRSLLSAPACLLTILCPPPSRCVPLSALGQRQWGPHWGHSPISVSHKGLGISAAGASLWGQSPGILCPQTQQPLCPLKSEVFCVIISKNRVIMHCWQVYLLPSAARPAGF